MIRRIQLVNFMSHDDTMIELADGLTVLVGPNNCGKSAVVAALQILCHNGASTHVIRHNETECRVVVTTDDGQTVEWKRTRTSVKYVVNGTVFDRLGRGNVPAEVHKVLRLPKVEANNDAFDIHFGEQKSPIFLINATGSRVAQFFAASSDAASLVKMQSLHKKRSVEARQRQTQLNLDVVRLTAELSRLAVADEVGEEVGRLEVEYVELCAAEVNAQGIARAIAALEVARVALRQLEARVAALASLAFAPVLVDTQALKTLVVQIDVAQQRSRRSEADQNAMQGLKVGPTLKPTEAMQQLTFGLCTKMFEFVMFAALRDAMAALRLPPELVSVDGRARDGVALEQAASLLSHREKTKDAVSSLTPPPVLLETQERNSTIRALREADTKCKLKTDGLESANVVFAEHDKRRRDWLKEHPLCPTCGETIDADRMAALHASCGEDEHAAS